VAHQPSLANIFKVDRMDLVTRTLNEFKRLGRMQGSLIAQCTLTVREHDESG